MDEKRASGRYYTRGNPFQLEPFQTWAKASNLEQQITLEPFAGAKDIPQLIDAANLQCRDWAFFDIEPGAEGVVQRDTLANFPKDSMFVSPIHRGWHAILQRVAAYPSQNRPVTTISTNTHLRNA